jgi:hypothetical protein
MRKLSPNPTNLMPFPISSIPCLNEINYPLQYSAVDRSMTFYQHLWKQTEKSGKTVSNINFKINLITCRNFGNYDYTTQYCRRNNKPSKNALKLKLNT